MARHRLLLASLVSLLCVQLTYSQSGVTRVWAVDDGEKVKRDDLSHWASNSADNPVWNGSQIRLLGARNEIVAFQVILESGASGATAVDVRIDSLTGPGYVISNRTADADPFNFVGRHIELFLEHYVNITFRSHSGSVSTWYGARPVPDEEHMGWVPDGLVPFEATPGTAEWVSGAPFAIGPRRNQGVWVDVYIPRDAPAGMYQGSAVVLESGTVTSRIPITLQVYGFTLSDSTHFRNFVHIDPVLLERHPGVTLNTPQYWAMFDKYMKFFHRHRMDLTDGRRGLSTFQTYLADYYTGRSYSRAKGYDGPGLGVGNGTYSIGTYDQFDQGSRSGFTPATQEGWWAAADAWEGWFVNNAPEVERFKYMRDEPDFQADTAYAYAEIRKRASWLHSNPGIGRNLRSFCTVKIDPRLYGAVDYWSLTSQSRYDPGDGILQGYIVDLVKERRALGEKVGFYNGTRPAFGLLEWIDNFATDPRVDPWIAWKYKVDQYFLWEMAFIYNKWYGEKQNPWVTPYSGSTQQTSRWGIGTIIYTGNDALFTQESRGIDGPIASIRLKNWRRGQQDYEYLHLAQQAGIDTRTIVDQVVPAAFDDYNGSTYTRQGQQPVWAQRGYLFERARAAIASQLDGTPKTDLPKGSFTLSPDTLPPAGGTVTLQWTSEGATAASIDQGVGSVATQGSQSVTVVANKTFRLTLSNQNGSITLAATVTVREPVSTAPTGTLNASPRILGYGGGSITLAWTSANATEAAFDNGIGAVALSGSTEITISKSTVFTLTLKNASATTILRDTVRVDSLPPTPTGTLNVSPRILGYGGGNITLAWTSANATEAAFDNGIGAVALSGSKEVTISKSTVFTLTLKNASATTILRDTVRVDSLPATPTGTFLANPGSLGRGGGPVRLSWTSRGAASATIDQGIGAVEIAGSRTVTVTRPTTFTLSLSNGPITTLLQAAVDVDTTPPPPEGTFTATPSSVPHGGGDVTLAWTSAHATLASIDQGIGAVPLSGTQIVRVTSAMVFQLILSNTAHQETLAVRVQVSPPPPPLRGVLDLAPATLPPGGGDVVLSWSSENASQASISNGIGVVPLSGTRAMRVERSATFVLTLTSDSDTLVLSKDIIVEEAIAPPQGVLAILPSVLPEGGGEVTLFWSTEKATRVSINHGVGVVPINGSTRVYVGSSLQFSMTVENGGGTIQSNASVSVASSTVRGIPSMVQNPDFEIGTAAWHFQGDGVGRISTEVTSASNGKALRVDIEQPGTVAQLYQAGISLEPQTRYRLEFEAWSATGHDLDVFIHQHYSPFVSYGLSVSTVDLEPEHTLYSYEFVTENIATPISDARLRFWFGPYAGTNDVYWIDNVLLQKLERTVSPLEMPVVAFPWTGSSYLPTSITVSWNDVPGASHYHIQVSEDSLFKSIAFEDSSLVDTLTQIGPFDPGKRLFLRVRADGEVAPGPYSPTYAFTTETSAPQPSDFTLEQNYPNPFNAGTEIRYVLAETARMSLKIFDLLGREIATLVDGVQPAGSYRVSVNGNQLASGTYFYVFQAAGYRDVRKMVLLR